MATFSNSDFLPIDCRRAVKRDHCPIKMCFHFTLILPFGQAEHLHLRRCSTYKPVKCNWNYCSVRLTVSIDFRERKKLLL